jgi:hypothetical protein
MFGLFSSPWKKAISRANVFFKNQFSELCECDDARIGLVLDMAADIKMSSLMLDSSGEVKSIIQTHLPFHRANPWHSSGTS